MIYLTIKIINYNKLTMKKIFSSFIAVCAVFMLGTAQQAMANNEPANEPAKVEAPR